ncbi:MAG: methyltransferase domain-containing protein [Desulfobacca sp.]|uniref:methyltransferase domain-containing protein n=1 Tax=Desulfobacca sp. TaxID=2067990 RepID=UPI00404ACA30
MIVALQSMEPSRGPQTLPPESTITTRSLVDLVWELRWRSGEGHHLETFYSTLNVWRDLDFCPPAIIRDLPGQAVGATLRYHFAAGEMLPGPDPKNIRDFPLASFAQGQLQPHLGRFYPLGLLREFPRSGQLCRCVGLTPTSLSLDLNHPLAGRPLELKVSVQHIRRKKGETGGQCQEWLGQLLDGPGQQSRWQGQPTDFFGAEAFRRQNEQPDQEFYTQPRLVSHLDAQARQTLSALYGRLLRPGWRVLDLMSSWQSHLPPAYRAAEVVGLGLNEAELRQNPQLTGYVVQDLNENPGLPWRAGSFDAVLCTVSVEYLTRPLQVFAEVRRLLKPGGIFVVSFANRWFPPKVVQIWTELLDFERLGLTLEYFLRTGGFTDLATFSARGWPRPVEDKYFPQMRFSDPIFAAWGCKED